MNVVLATGIYPPEIGGPATFTRDLADALRAEGDVVQIVTYGDASTLSGPVPVTIVSRGKSVLWRYARYAWQTFVLARTADVVFAQGPVSEGVPAALAAWLARKPFVLKVVGDVAWEAAQRGGYARSLDEFLQEKPPSLNAALIRWLQGMVARYACRILVPSRYLQGVVCAWGVPQTRIAVIYNAVHRVRPDESEPSLRAAFGLEGKRLWLAGGRLVPWKRIDLLLKMLVHRPDADVLLVAGEGPCMPVWQRLAMKLGVAGRVVWLGRCSAARLASWYRVATAFLLPSLYEGLPHMPLEAAQYGCPSFVSRCGGNPEAAEIHPALVQVVPSDDPLVWSRALDGLRAPDASVTPPPWTQSLQMRAYRTWISSVSRG